MLEFFVDVLTNAVANVLVTVAVLVLHRLRRHQRKRRAR